MTRFAHGLMGLLAIAIVSLSAASAEAQMRCDMRDNAITHLAEKFDEQVVGRGLTKGGQSMVEILVSESGTWTVLVTDTNGRTCLMATGEDWADIRLLVGDPV